MVVARMRLIGRTRFDECKHPGRASLVGSRAANYRALFWLPDAFEPLPKHELRRSRAATYQKECGGKPPQRSGR